MSRLVLFLACALAGCAADTEDLEGANREPDAGTAMSQLDCAFLSGNCCGDAILEVACTSSQCSCPEGTIPARSCPICQFDATTPVPQISCVQDLGSCCSDSIQSFDCTSEPCMCPPGYKSPQGCPQCRADGG